MTDETFLTGVQRTFDPSLLLVSKTDPRGVITYANSVFAHTAGYAEEELLGKPHNIIRHPDMPRTAFSFMWEELLAGREFFAYVINRARTGDHYWVFAHVVPDFDPETGQIIGFHSARRWASPAACQKAMAVYERILDVESRATSPRQAVTLGRQALIEILTSAGITYEQWVFSL